MRKDRVVLYRILRYPAEGVFRLLSGFKIYGKEKIPKSGAMILAGNHVGNADPLLICASTSRVVHFLGKIELFKNPFTRWVFTNCAVTPVDRSKHNPDAMRAVVEQLEDGKLVGIFPEGTRNKTKDLKMLPFKFGAVSLASKTNCKILPFAIKGHFKFFKNELRVLYGDPISIEGMDLEEANEYLKNTISKLMDEIEGVK